MVFKFLKKYWLLIVVTVSLVAVQAITNLCLPDLTSNIVDKGIAKGDTKYILQLGVKMLLFSGIGILASIIASYTAANVSMKYGRDLRNAVFKKIEDFSLVELSKFSPATLLTRTTNDVVQVQQATVFILRMVVMAPIMAVGGILMAVNKDPKLTAVLGVTLPAMLVFMFIIVKIVSPLFKSLQEKIDKINLVMRERVTGIRIIRAFDNEENEVKRFTQVNEDLTKTALKVNRIAALIFPVLTIALNFTVIAIIWLGTKQVDIGKIQVGTIMAVMQYVLQIMFSFIMLSVIFIFLPRASVSAKRIDEVLTLEPSIVVKSGAEKLDKNESIEIEFRNVTFYYPGAKEPALKDVSFKILPGEIAAIVGPTGSGKSTILNLIMRFYEPTSGEIFINGKNIKNIDIKQLRELVGYAIQKPIIFTDTIFENVRFKRPWVTDKDVNWACDIAQVNEFAEKMPEKLQTVLTEGGTNLSGGQKQRISLARAIAGRPKLYLFDDTFSALDFKTDARIRLRLFKEIKCATVLIVAQRVSTVLNSDKIVVIKDGKVDGIGNHKELLKTSETYREIVHSQIAEEEAGERNG